MAAKMKRPASKAALKESEEEEVLPSTQQFKAIEDAKESEEGETNKGGQGSGPNGGANGPDGNVQEKKKPKAKAKSSGKEKPIVPKQKASAKKGAKGPKKIQKGNVLKKPAASQQVAAGQVHWVCE